ncbi:10 TM acyl transferase domain found in Cas1p-domain-containing protein [Phycomyces blakesleeanus]
MLNDGWWLDDAYKVWQPSGCMMHNFQTSEISSCLGHSKLLYIGDSVVRQQFYATATLIRENTTSIAPGHTDVRFDFTPENLSVEFWWDPYLNSTRTVELLESRSTASRPSLLVVGTGLWHMRHLEDDYYVEWRNSVNRVFDAVQGNKNKNNKIADAVVMAPVELPFFDQLSKDRHDTITLPKVEVMNGYLKDRQSELELTTSFAIPFAWNKISVGMNNATKDGLHFYPSVTQAQIQLGLNYRCNDQLPKTFPMSNTCCFRYPTPRWYQTIFFFLFLVWIPFGMYLAGSGYMKSVTQCLFPSESVLKALFLFGLCVIYMFFGDRTHLFGKIHKHFDPAVFGGLLVAVLVGGLVSLKSTNEGDLGFLNRDQTDEWKGWMQVIILVYHFTGASSVSGIYNAVRVLVAGYLFQTGYGHFFFFYKKGDYGLGRILNVVVRLNMLTFVLQYLMDTDYLSYYFTPLVSFWFFVIWITMYIHNKANRIVWFLLLKIVIASMVTTTLIHYPGILETIFEWLKLGFNIDWDAVEWRFRLRLDAWIVYVGMLSAFAYIKCMEYKLHESGVWPMVKKTCIGLSCVGMTWYFWFELSQDTKVVYNNSHPYISWVPILAFVVLRNATAKLRNTSSRFYCFIGKISLETFIGQFHMWLAGDTRGLLVVLARPEWARGLGWWLNLGISTILFLSVSYYLGQATTELTKWICSGVNKASQSVGAPRYYETNATSATSAAAAAIGGGNGGGNEYQSIPLLPATTQTLDTSVHTETSAESPSVSARGSIDEELGSPVKRPSWTERIGWFWGDVRVKCVAFLLCLGIVNRLC